MVLHGIRIAESWVQLPVSPHFRKAQGIGSCLASLGNSERKNTPCISDLAGVKFLLKKERVFFFRGSALQVFGQCGVAKCGLGFAKTIFWGKGFGKTETNLNLHFVRAEEGSGEESARAF